MLSDYDMRQILCEAFRVQFGREGRRCEMQCVQAVAWLETSYGAGWKAPQPGEDRTGSRCFNFGACQAGPSWAGPTFVYTDTHPTSSGASVPYTVKFRAYHSALEGARDLVKIVYVNRGRAAVLEAAGRQDTAGFSRQLHNTGYYEGFGATVGERISHHHDAVVKAIRRQCSALAEPLPNDIATMPVPHATLRLGAKGADVRVLQEALAKRGARITIDGGFGPATLLALQMFQRASGLSPDGIVGPATWRALGLAT